MKILQEELYLTQKEDWDLRWQKIQLPLQIKKEHRNQRLNSRLEVFEKFLPSNDNLSVLEIGGAPGQYLAFMAKKLKCHISALDYSTIGCRKTQKNLKLLNLDGKVYQKNLLEDDLSELPKYDVVYSLGFIEHFKDYRLVIEKHLQLLKKKGTLIIGVPNLRGVNYWFMKMLSPEKIKGHNLRTMDIRTWNQFESFFKLKRIYRGYIGGFQPLVSCERQTYLNKSVIFCLKNLNSLSNRIGILGRINSKYWSTYLIGVYQKHDQ